MDQRSVKMRRKRISVRPMGKRVTKRIKQAGKNSSVEEKGPGG